MTFLHDSCNFKFADKALPAHFRCFVYVWLSNNPQIEFIYIIVWASPVPAISSNRVIGNKRVK